MRACLLLLSQGLMQAPWSSQTQVAMAGLDSMMVNLTQRRKTCGDQIEADLAEVEIP